MATLGIEVIEKTHQKEGFTVIIRLLKRKILF